MMEDFLNVVYLLPELLPSNNFLTVAFTFVYVLGLGLQRKQKRQNRTDPPGKMLV